MGVLVSYLSTRVNSFNNALVRASPSRSIPHRTRDSSSVFERTACVARFSRSGGKLTESPPWRLVPNTPSSPFPALRHHPPISRNSIFIARDRASRSLASDAGRRQISSCRPKARAVPSVVRLGRASAFPSSAFLGSDDAPPRSRGDIRGRAHAGASSAARFAGCARRRVWIPTARSTASLARWFVRAVARARRRA